MEYIIAKGSACAEAFRELSYLFAHTFGHPNRTQRSKEVNVGQDFRLLNRSIYFVGKQLPKSVKRAAPSKP